MVSLLFIIGYIFSVFCATPNRKQDAPKHPLCATLRTKKAPSSVKGREPALRVTTFFHLCLTAEASSGTLENPIYPSAITGGPVAACALRQSVRGSGTIFFPTFRISFHHWRLSGTFHRKYSSLHSLCLFWYLTYHQTLRLSSPRGDVQH